MYFKYYPTLHLSLSSQTAGSVAAKAEAEKLVKYAEIASSADYIFTPIAIETLGAWGPSADAICSDIGARLSSLTGDIRATAFLKQRLAIDVQKGNAAAINGTSPLVSMTLENLFV